MRERRTGTGKERRSCNVSLFFRNFHSVYVTLVKHKPICTLFLMVFAFFHSSLQNPRRFCSQVNHGTTVLNPGLFSFNLAEAKTLVSAFTFHLHFNATKTRDNCRLHGHLACKGFRLANFWNYISVTRNRLLSHKIKIALSFYVHFQIRKQALYGGTTVQRKI